MKTLLKAELARRAEKGMYPTTIHDINAALKSLGYTLDRRDDCKSLASWACGEWEGHSFPCLTTGVKDIDSGISFSHVNCRNPNLKALQAIRHKGDLFAVVQGHILEF